MLRRRRYHEIVVLCAGALVSWGCGGGDAPAKFPSARLEGVVTVDGKPIEDGTIQFVPADKSAGGVTQAMIVEGRFVASQVPLGEVTAMLFATPPPPPENLTTDYKPAPMVTIPDRYKKGFKITVKENKSDVDFAMSSK